MTSRGWDSKDIIRSAFITPAGNCFLRMHKRISDCFLKCPIVLQVPVTNQLKLVSSAPSMYISVTDPTTPCLWGTGEQWQEKWDPIERDLWGWQENPCDLSLETALTAPLCKHPEFQQFKVEEKTKRKWRKWVSSCLWFGLHLLCNSVHQNIYFR